MDFGSNQDYHDKDGLGSEQSFNSILLNLTKWNEGQRALTTRLGVVICFMAIFFLSISYKIITTALSSSSNNTIFASESGLRKEIVDRNGVLLAINLPSYSLYANPSKMLDKEEAAHSLKEIFPELDEKKLLRNFASNKRFVWVKRDLSSKEKLEVNNLGLPGVYFEQEYKRVYTHGNMFAHIIGYVGRDNEGLAGLERSYDQEIKNYHGNEPPIELTLDSRLQAIVNEELDKTIKTYRPESAAAIVMDPNNGEVLACISKPDFNPHYPGKAKSKELFNAFATGVYELGSINKILNLAVGFDTGKVALNDAYDTTSMKVANFMVKDWHQTKGWHSVPEIFLKSSNVGMAQILFEIGKEDYREYLNKMGLTKKLDIEIPEKATPMVSNYKKWSDLTMVTMSYGYSIAMTPLHFTAAAAAAINGGIIYPLSFVKKKGPIAGERIFNTTTSKKVHKLLFLAAEKGTSRKARVPGYFVGAKTGTANKLIGKKYAENSARISSMLSIFPANDPKYLIFIMLDNPKPTKETFGFATAGWTVAPMVSNLVRRMVALYGLSPYDENEENIRNELHVDYEINSET